MTEQNGHHCLSAIEVVRTDINECFDFLAEEESPLPVGN